MIVRFDPATHVLPYAGCRYAADRTGYCVWRRGTGGNAEILHLRAYEPRRGFGRLLLAAGLRRMLAEDPPPHTSVFGFTRPDPLGASGFYRKMGFLVTHVTGVYADGSAALFAAPFSGLVRLHCTDRKDGLTE